MSLFTIVRCAALDAVREHFHDNPRALDMSVSDSFSLASYAHDSARDAVIEAVANMVESEDKVRAAAEKAARRAVLVAAEAIRDY